MKLFLIDGNAYVYRAFYAIKGLTDVKGNPTNAVFGFTNMLLKIMREKEPDAIVVSFDVGKYTKRHEIYPEYKATRSATPEELLSQMPVVKDVVRAMNIPIYEAEGYEADDVLATLATRAASHGTEVYVVSSDKDMLQIVNEQIKVYDPMKDKLMDRDEVIERFSLPPERVTQYMALVGDASDNVPGVKGVGDKTAKGLLAQFSSLEDLIENVESIEKPRIRKLITEGVDNIHLSKRLVELDHHVPIDIDTDDLKLTEPDWDGLRDMFIELGFTSLLKQLPDGTGSTSPTAEPAAPTKEREHECVLNEDRLMELLATKSDIIAMDTESTGPDPMTAMLVGYSFMYPGGKAVYVPLRHNYLGVPKQIDDKRALSALGKVMADADIAKCGHNLKYDIMLLAGEGITTRGRLYDTMLASYVLNPERQHHSLESVALDHLGQTKQAYKEVAGKLTFDQVEIEKAAPYGALDSELALELKDKLFAELETEGLMDVYDKLEEPLIGVLGRMEQVGVNVDSGMLNKASKKLSTQMRSIEQRIYVLAGHEFNINSPKQLGHVLFEELKLTPGKKKKTGYSTDVGVLETLKDEHELPAEVLKYRQLAKLKNTYTDVLPKLVNPKTGRLHTTFRQTGTSTGRLSSSEPNLQNIPVRSEWGKHIRECFTAKEGTRLISADYSQIELRVLAHMSRDEVLMDAFTNDEDIHSRTAREIFGIEAADEVTTDMRRVAKTVNFGVIYGISAFGLAASLGIARHEADSYIKLYFQRHPGIAAFIEHMVEQGKEQGYVSTLYGRRRPVPELRSSNRNTRMLGERLAINSPIQGTAADIIKLAMIEVDRQITEQALASRMVLQVHDELIIEAPIDEADRAAELLRQAMQGAATLSIPLKVDIGRGDNWAQAH